MDFSVKHRLVSEDYKHLGTSSLICGPAGVNDEVDLVSDSLSMENNAKTISVVKKRKKKKKSKKGLAKESFDQCISQNESSEICQHSGVTPSYQSSNEIDCLESICEKNTGSDSQAITSISASQMHEFSDDQCVHKSMEHPETIFNEIPDLSRNLMQTQVGNCNNSQISPCCKANESKQGTEPASNSCFTQDLQDNHFSQLSKFRSYKITSDMSCKVEDCSGCGNENTKMSQMNSQVCKVGMVATPEEINCTSLTGQHGIVKAISHQPSRANGKENRNFICERNHNNGMGARRSNFRWAEKDGNFMERNFAVKHNSFSSKGLSSTPFVCSDEHYNFGCRVQKVGKKETFMSTRFCDRAFVEPSQWDNKQRFSGRLSQYGTQSHSSKHGNYSNVTKEQEACEPNLFGQLKPELRQKVQLQFGPHHYKKGNPARASIYNVPCCSMFNGFQTCNQKRIPRVKHAFERSSDSSSGSEPCSESDLYNFQQGVHSVWVPVAARGSSMLKSTKSGGAGSGFDVKAPMMRLVGNDSHLFAKTAPLSESPSFLSSESQCPTSCHKMTSPKSETPNLESCSSKIASQMVMSSSDSVECDNKRNNTLDFSIGSLKAMEALNAAYKLQLESESFQRIVKCPHSEIERLLHSAAPVISPSHACEKCTVCSSDRLFHDRLCKHQIPNSSISCLWDWYENPGNYGLEVRTEVPKSISFQAYFVPSLSAIQLFYPHRCSYCNENGDHVEPHLQGKKEFESKSPSSKAGFATGSSEAVKPSHLHADCTSLVEELHLPKPSRSSNIPTCICCGSSRMNSSLACSTNAELVFEFFESDQPQERKPLHLKILDLMNAGTSRDKFFGDPSKLESTNLRDLHPASWFSVAWYPIYRVPEGKFRASFLTFHSLGFLTQRSNQTDTLGSNTCSVVSPVLGLESYNARDECWFHPKLQLQFFSPGVLEERLRALEENASLFARGCVHKDDAEVFNRQPDYEFFVSRKHPLAC